ncbi:MAG: DEAD/DEAH box helicase [bacterium]
MPPVVKTEDQNVLVATLEFPYAKWKFEKFNPVQSRCMEFFDKDTNGLIAASTSAGKTVVAEMFISSEVRNRGGKGMFLAPLRALGREKYVEWTDKKHHFGDLKTSICTGDYRLTPNRIKELDEADIIIMTSEMLNHRSRNIKAENSKFLMDTKTLVIDESHLLTVPGRGDHLEVGLMKFTQLNPKARIVLLSATMPNVEEIADWISYSLTKNNTFLLKSQYRPVPLTIHYEIYDDSEKRYDLVEAQKVEKALDIVEDYPDDKFLIFAHTKKTGELMKQGLKQIGVESHFHNADLEGDQRAALEDRFKNDPSLKVIIATSTLAWGLNLPARRVIILGIHRGLSEVETYDITQMIGRSGRLGIDPMGDAYILIPDSKAKECKSRLSKPTRIESQLLNKVGDKHKVLAFHLVSEIVNKSVQTTEDVENWYKRTLAYFQNKILGDHVVDDTLELLQKCGAIQKEGNIWVAKPIGKVSSMFYFSPFDVSDLYFNFKNLFENNQEDDEYLLSMALANTDSQKSNIISKAEKEEMSLFAARLRNHPSGGRFSNDAAIKSGFCYFNLLNGSNSNVCANLQRNLQFDYNRVSQVLIALDSLAAKWGREVWFRNLEGRISYGVPVHLVDICSLSGIAKVRANKLYNAGFTTIEKIASSDVETLKKVLNMKKENVENVLKEAQGLVISRG